MRLNPREALEPNCIECADQLTNEDHFEGLCDKCAKREGILE